MYSITRTVPSKDNNNNYNLKFIVQKINLMPSIIE